MLAFTQFTKPDYDANWHHAALCRHLDRLLSGDIRRLLVFMPPRHGKSELVSRRFPAYVLGRQPHAGIIACSYGADLASRMNRDVQRIIGADAYAALFPQTRLFSSNGRSAQAAYLRNSDIFEIVNRRGFYRSAGVGGGITGMGCDFGIIDDPVKNRKEANSATFRNALWDWYTSTFYTRLEKDARILITLTRWHKDDLAGRLLDSSNAGDWTILSLPAIALDERQPDDPRMAGEPLWINKFDLPTLSKIREQNLFEWEALYQQSPKPAGGGLFATAAIEIVDTPPVCRTVVRFYDLAVTEDRRADFSVGLKLGVTDDERFVVLDVWRAQKELPDVHEAIVQNARIDGYNVAIRLEAEKAGIVQLQFLLRDKRMRAYAMDAKAPYGDKYTRAAPVASRCSTGRVTLVRGAWNRAFIDELAMFPAAAHDDQVDALSGAYSMLAGGDGVLTQSSAPDALSAYRG